MKHRVLKAIGSAMLAVMMFISSSVPSFAAASNYPLVDGYADITSIKGLQAKSDSESSAYGSEHGFHNFDITQCYIPDDYIECGIPYYEFEGKKYRFFDYTYILSWVKRQNNAGRTANVQFMISWEDRDTDGYGSLSQRRLLIDEASRTKTSAYYYAPATSGEGKQILRAFWSWFMDSLAASGAHIDNLILGNEVNAPNSWHYSGNAGTQATVEKYAAAFYDMRKIVRNYSDKTRCSICFDHTWNYNDASGVIGAREYLSIFNNTLTILNGGTVVDDWCVAMHLYPTVLFQPAIWQDTPGYPSNMNALSQDAGWVDGKNLSYITNYIKNNYGENHRIMLTEQGFTVYRGEEIQAASLAYSYYAAKYDSMVDCFILYTDTTGDSRLDFSINGRIAESIYKKIDDASYQTSIANQLLPVIGVNSWSDIIPNYGQTIQRKQYQGSGFTGVVPTGITLDTTTSTLTVGQTQSLMATVLPSNATNQTVTWTSSNSGVVSVNNGFITANAAGTAVITAKTVNGYTAQCTVKVVVYPTGISLDTTEANMIAGETIKLNAAIAPSNATETKLTWTSSDTKVAYVSNGTVIANGPGIAVITAQTVNGLKAQCTVYCIIEDNQDNPFGDVSASRGWEYPYVKYVYDNQYMGGKGEIIPGKIKFDPNTPLTRAEFVQILYSFEEKPEVTYTDKFTDIPNGQWYTDAVLWAADQEIVAGKGDFFDPHTKATREELALMFYQYANYKNYGQDSTPDADSVLTGYEDAGQISNWAKNGLEWAVAHQIMSGKGTKLDPAGDALRSECAAMLKGFIDTFVTAQEDITE